MRHAATATARPFVGGIRVRGKRRAPGRRRAGRAGSGSPASVGDVRRVAWTAGSPVTMPAAPASGTTAAAPSLRVAATRPAARRQRASAPHSATVHPLAARFAQALAHLPYLIALAGTAAALAAIRVGAASVRSGTLVLAGVLLFAAMARLALPDGRAGMLSSRRRWLDVATLASFGMGLLAAALVAVPA